MKLLNFRIGRRERNDGKESLAAPEMSEDLMSLAIQTGHEELNALLSKYSLDLIDTSHPYHNDHEVVQQCRAACLRGRTFQEMVLQSLFVRFIHIFDDQFDSPEEEQNRNLFYKNRHQMGRFLGEFGNLGLLALEIAEKAVSPAYVLKSYKKVGYGGLIENGFGGEACCKSLLEEYKDFNTRILRRSLANDIHERLSPEAYFLTSKSIQELPESLKTGADLDCIEVMSLAYAPLFYLHDLDCAVSSRRSESGFWVSNEELLGMLQLVSDWIPQFPALVHQRKGEWISVMTQYLRSLPSEIQDAYEGVTLKFETGR